MIKTEFQILPTVLFKFLKIKYGINDLRGTLQ